MKYSSTVLLIAASLLAGASPRAQTLGPTELRIYTAVELEFQTEIGKTYTLQGALNFTNWTDLGNPVLGNGRTVNQIFSTKAGALAKCTAYRLRVDDGPTNGFAPWSLAGVRVQMGDPSATNVVEYLTGGGGQDLYATAPAPFTYLFSRLSENEGQVDRSFTPDQHEVLTYSYTAPGAGTWVRDAYNQGLLQRRDLGVFRYLADTNTVGGSTNPPPIIGNQPPAPPLTLTGLVYYVQSGALPDQISFQTATSGSYSPAATGHHVESTGNTFAYTYQVESSNTASLSISFGYYGVGGDRHEYDLTYTDGPSGLFTRRIYRLGTLYATDSGAFSPYATQLAPPGTNNPPGETNSPSANPAGLTYTVLSGQTPERLVFQTGAAGIDYDDSGPSEFSFTDQSTGLNTFSLVVRFKPDRWDEYDLTFANGAQGSFVRRRYKNNALDRTDAGSFTVAPTGH